MLQLIESRLKAPSSPSVMNGQLARTAITVFVMAMTGCGFTLPEEFTQEIPTVDEVAPSPDPTPTTVTIRFRNLSTAEAVNVEFYAATAAPESIPDDLFIETNLVTSSIGVAGTGILEPLREDILDLPCTSDLVIGTLGGAFLDNETGATLGLGQSRWAQDNAQGLCGRDVLFEFGSVSGEFRTRISIEN